VLRGTFKRKKDEVPGGWRKLNNKELHNFEVFLKKCYYDDEINEDEVDGTCGTHAEYGKSIHNFN
jgi:hypothetical protein